MSYPWIWGALALSFSVFWAGCEPSAPTPPSTTAQTDAQSTPTQEKSLKTNNNKGKVTPVPSTTPHILPLQTTPAQEEKGTSTQKDTKEPSENSRKIPNVEGVPALYDPFAAGAKRVKLSARQGGIGFNSKGLAQHTKAKDYVKASAFYIKALESDPSHIVARYNLACALALQGDKERAIGILNQLRALDCGECRVRLMTARHDNDFKSLREEPAFKHAVSGELGVDTELLKTTTLMFHKRFSTVLTSYTDFLADEGLSALVHPQRTYLVKFWNSYTKGPEWKEFGKAADFMFLSGFRSPMYISPSNGSPEGMVCKGMCCTLEKRPIKEDRILQKVCYWVTSDGQLYLDRVFVRDTW